MRGESILDGGRGRERWTKEAEENLSKMSDLDRFLYQ